MRGQFTKRVETWAVTKPGKKNKVTIVKVAVRSSDGKFHGATNFREKKVK